MRSCYLPYLPRYVITTKNAAPPPFVRIDSWLKDKDSNFESSESDGSGKTLHNSSEHYPEKTVEITLVLENERSSQFHQSELNLYENYNIKSLAGLSRILVFYLLPQKFHEGRCNLF